MNTQPSRILVVDDDIDSAEGLALLLRHLGHQVQVVSTGRSALAEAGVFQPTVAIIDIGLPDVDGLEVAAELRRSEATRHCHLLALTGLGQNEDIERGLDAGFERYLVKPVALPDLVESVDAAILAPAVPIQGPPQ